MVQSNVRSILADVSAQIEAEFLRDRRRLSFQEYLDLFAVAPSQHGRDASRYVRDMVSYFGSDVVERPWGRETRYRLFDQAFNTSSRRSALVAQEEVQQEFFRALCNFGREGRANRLVLVHGPNGSAKTTFARCILRGLEHYSCLDEGALYRFHWVFPARTVVRGQIGFSGRRGERPDGSYAHLPEDELDARLFVEVRDHPLFLIPVEARQSLLTQLYEATNADEPAPEWLSRGTLSQKSRQVFDALLSSYDGSLQEVLRHVQVERYYISRRYRVGAVTVGPELSVDAGERQLTADRSVMALPASLQSQSLYETFGELVDASGGVIEFSDLLKRPLDSYKYLQGALETAEVSLRAQIVELNCVFIGSANEIHLAAFREHPEYESFQGRLELIRMGYLRSYLDEQQIYDAQIVPHVRTHVAPHATRVAAKFAVLSRLFRPNPERYEGRVKQLVADLTLFEKAELYASGTVPPRLDDESAKLLRAEIRSLYREFDNEPVYEGISGASPREMQRVLLDAAQNPAFQCLSPIAVLAELEKLCERTSEYPWLQTATEPGGYHDQNLIVAMLRGQLVDWIEDEFRVASGIVEPSRYRDLFGRYVTQVSFWLKGELLPNPLTGVPEPANESFMREVEQMLDLDGEAESFRRDLISRVAAWAIERPDQDVQQDVIFAAELQKLRHAAFADRRGAMDRLCQDVWILLREGGIGLDLRRERLARDTWLRLRDAYGYEEASAADAARLLYRERFKDGKG